MGRSFNRFDTVPSRVYDSTKTFLSSLMVQRTGAGVADKFAGPAPVELIKPVEQMGVGGTTPYILDADDRQYIFIGDSSTAAATRRVGLWERILDTGVVSYKGYITLTFPTATNHTTRSLVATRDLETTGTVAVSGTAVTGTSTLFSTRNISVGARIGFGSTDPKLIANWFTVSAIASDTGITLAVTAGTVAGGSAYVIEELRIVTLTTNATTTNGGLFLAKGLNPDIFIPAGTTIPAATTVDKIRAVYWLADAATVLNITGAGLSNGIKTDHLNQFVYVLDGAATSARIFRYNVRVALAGLAAGKTTSAFSLATGTQTVTGNISQSNNLARATTSHGPGSGVECLYFVTASRVYRVPTANVTNGSTAFLTDSMTEVPKGGTTTFAATGNLNSLDYSDLLDRFVLTTSSLVFVTQYRADGGQFDHTAYRSQLQSSQATADSTVTSLPNTFGLATQLYVRNGLLVLLPISVNTITNIGFVIPLGADWAYSGVTGERLITKAITTPGVGKLGRINVLEDRNLGGDSLGMPPEPFKIWARVSGISDNTGAWTQVDELGDLSGLTPGAEIQFSFTFKTIGTLGIPARLLGFEVTWDDQELPSELDWKLGDSSDTNGTVGFVQTLSFGSLPVLEINYYRQDTNALVLTQLSSGTTNGAFEYWTGSAWAAGLGTDTVGLRRRFVPSSGLPNTQVYPTLRKV